MIPSIVRICNHADRYFGDDASKNLTMLVSLAELCLPILQHSAAHYSRALVKSSEGTLSGRKMPSRQIMVSVCNHGNKDEDAMTDAYRR